jgi:methylated-DNA-[protein]-cysteine S-methyltransferase
MDSPVGRLRLVSDGQALTRIEFETETRERAPEGTRSTRPFRDVRRQLEEYFAGERRSFDLPLRPAGTPFQLATWRALRYIPYGETRSYSEVAQRIGKPRAVRAVGAANGRNPLPIVIPCHRVIGASGALTGFAGGLPLKRFLLELEGA